MNDIRTVCRLAVALLALAAVTTIGTAWVRADDGGGAEVSAGVTLKAPQGGDSSAAIFYAIAFTVGISCVSAGYAVGKVGAAALGAAAEKPELLGRAIIFVGLAEGIAIYGLIIGLFLINKL
jgi:V/A-type H+-transporting ATPase subunit K